MHLKKTRDFLVGNEWIIVLVIVAIFVISVLSTTNALYSGHLSKVDFTTSFGKEHLWSGWSTSNFGSPIGLNKSVVVYLNVTSTFPTFPFKDLVFYYVAPCVIVGKALFLWVDFHLRERLIAESKLVAAYTVLFFFTSVIFLSVFLYGWNLIILLPIAGLAFACHGVDVFYKSKEPSSLLWVALGGFLIGGMVQFIFVPLLYTIDRRRSRKQIFSAASVLLLSNAYTLIPQAIAIVFNRSPFYKGVDPIEQTETNQRSVQFLSRISGAFDPGTRPYWNQTIWIFILLLGILGISLAKRQNLGTSGARIGFVLFAGLNFSGIFWSISFNRAWTYLPAIGGMLRNPDKIFAVFIIFVFILAAFWLKSHQVLRCVVAVCLLTLSSGVYFSSGLKPAAQIAQVKLPQSYVDVQEVLTTPNTQNRILLLPVPNWFHFYSWTSAIQTTNLLRVAIDVPVVSDEMNPVQTIPFEYWQMIEDISSKVCSQGRLGAKTLGITKIVLQQDLLRVDESSIEDIRSSLGTCFGEPIFTSTELVVFNVKGSQGRFFFPDKDEFFAPQTSIRSTTLGYKVCTSKPTNFIIREKASKLTYQIFASPFKRIGSVTTDLGWRNWALPSPGCYGVVNFSSVIAIFSLLVSLSTLTLLFVFRKKSLRED